MIYKAENVDTDKAMNFLDDCLKSTYSQELLEKSKIERFYAGYREGLETAKNIFFCSNYEKEEK